MRIGVQLTGIDSDSADVISVHLGMKWDPSEVIVFRDAPAGGKLDGLLLIGDGPAPPDSGLITDTVDVGDGPEGVHANLDDIIFQADVKLGRLTKSYLARQSTQSYLKGNAKLSRRELLLGVTKDFQRYSGLPRVFNDSCEAKRGCTKCVDICPAKALHLNGSSITVSEADCTVCGMCAAVCPVGAVQMPEFSDAALFGLLDEIDESSAVRKTLVLTCDSKAIRRRPWMVVEKVSTVGMFGPRQIAAAATSSVGGVALVCPDGQCPGKDLAKTAAVSVGGSIAAGPTSPFIAFIEDVDDIERLAELHESSKARAPRATRSGDKWKDYVSDLTVLLSPDSSTSGLGLTKLAVAESCTLCSACVKLCPHESLRQDGKHLFFRASSCTGCGLCVKTCPEHSMTLSAASGKMSSVMQTEKVYEDELVTCTNCGTPVGSAKFVAKVSSLLGPDAKSARLCPNCKKQQIVEMLLGGRRNG